MLTHPWIEQLFMENWIDLSYYHVLGKEPGSSLKFKRFCNFFCRNLNSDTPVLWQIGTQNIIPNLLAVESQGRIYVTNKDAIRINKLEQQDAGIYSCWQRNQLAGTIRLEVIKRIRITFNHHVMLLGIFCTLGTFQFLLVKAYMNRKLIHEK